MFCRATMATTRRGLTLTRRRNPILFFSFLIFIVLGIFVPVFALFPLLSSTSLSTEHHPDDKMLFPNFEIRDDNFWRDGKPFRIIGGELHYFRVLPEYWEDRLLRAKALGLNTIQTYVPWNLHEPKPGKMAFEGITDLMSFLKLCKKLDFLVLLRAGPYICGEWDLGGFPAWLLSIEPSLKLRTSDPTFLQSVERWWAVLLPKVAPFLYSQGGPVAMIQIENEYGSYGNDKAYLHHLVKVARGHLGNNVILYTTDGGSRETLEKGTVPLDDVFSAVDFTTGDEPWPIFELQKKFNSPGKSPPLSSEFYTGWLTHWGEKIAKTDAHFTAAALAKILSRNGSAVLYMVHGGTNFGFYNGANTGANEGDYKPDLTSYDYDAPIKESGDVDNPKYHALRKVIQQYSAASLPPVPSDSLKGAFGAIQMQRDASLFDLVDANDLANLIVSDNPISMESAGQLFGFLLYVTEYVAKTEGSSLHIPKVHDRAQVFISCSSNNTGGVMYVDTIKRWSNQAVVLPKADCASNTTLFILVENMGRVNYGPYMFDEKGILSPVYLDGEILHGWRMIQIPLHNLNEKPKASPIFQTAYTRTIGKKLELISEAADDSRKEPALFTGSFSIHDANEVRDTYILFNGWGKGITFINEFNIGRYWPTAGPQCNLYVPAPILRPGKNSVVILELESPHLELVLHSVDHPDFTCGSGNR